MNAQAFASSQALPLPSTLLSRGLAAPWQKTKAWLRAALFLQKLQQGSAGVVACSQRKLVAADGIQFIADEYWPSHTKAVALPTILLVHGLSPLAHQDPRMVNLARALAAVGFRVVAPEFAEVRHLVISPVSIDNIARCIRSVAMEYKSANYRIGVFSASFCGGVSLLAAARPEAAAWVSGLLALGSYTDVTSTLQYLLSSEKADAYGRLLILKNFIHHSIGHDPEVQLALQTAIADNFYGRQPGDLAIVLQRLRPHAVHLVQTLLDHAAVRRYHFDRIRPQLKQISAALDVIRNVSRVKAPVWLLHGEDDNIIPANQSRLLHAALRRAGKRSTLLVSPLLGHSNVSLSFSTMPELAQLISAVADYFYATAHPTF